MASVYNQGLCQIEKQYLGRLLRDDLERVLFADGRAVALFKFMAVYLNCPTRYL